MALFCDADRFMVTTIVNYNPSSSFLAPLPSREFSPNGLNGYVTFSYDYDGHIWAAVNAGVLMQSMSMCPLSIGSSLP